MSILITGINGFLGNHLADYFHAKGSSVIGLDVDIGSFSKPWPVFIGDLTKRAFIENFFKENEISQVIHCGGVASLPAPDRNLSQIFEVNVNGTLNLFEACRTHRLCKKLVFISSAAVYGSHAEASSIQRPVIESDPVLSCEPYGCSKIACESLLRAYASRSEMEMLALRLSMIYGPGRVTYCGITQMLKSALAGGPIVLARGADLPLPWIYIDDVCFAIDKVLSLPKQGFKDVEALAYNLAGPGSASLKEIAQIVQALVPKAVIQESTERDIYAGNPRRIDISAVQRDLGWEPKVTIAEGVRSLYKFLRGLNGG